MAALTFYKISDFLQLIYITETDRQNDKHVSVLSGTIKRDEKGQESSKKYALNVTPQGITNCNVSFSKRLLYAD